MRRGRGKLPTPEQLAERLLTSPQLSPDTAHFPLLSSLLSPLPLTEADGEWSQDHLPEVYASLGYPLPGWGHVPSPSPLDRLDDLLYLCFMHRDYPDRPRHLKVAQSRLAYLGGFVLELALAEFLLQRYPREVPAALRERVFKLTNKRVLPLLLEETGLSPIVLPRNPMYLTPRTERESASKAVFWALVGALYVTQGMPEVYRLLFEVYRLDPDAESAAPTGGRPRDEDLVGADFEGAELLGWQDVAAFQAPESAVVEHPRLFRACVPPGMRRFARSDWEQECLAPLQASLHYPLAVPGTDPRLAAARNEELALALQLCFLHPSLHRRDHPRFCYERLEFLGQRIQDLVVAEMLLQGHLDAPGPWLADRHGTVLRNTNCGRYLREKRLDRFVHVAQQFRPTFEDNRKARQVAGAAVFQALGAAGYLVYGKREVRRLLFHVWHIDKER